MREKGPTRLHGLDRVLAAISIVSLGVLVQGCSPTTKPTPSKPTEAVELVSAPTGSTTPQYKVRRNQDIAWATLYNVNQFDQLTGSAWQNLIQTGLVTTDASGQAELCPSPHIVAGTQYCSDVACHIYVFGASGLGFGYYCCQEKELGTDACACMGSQTFDGCPFKVTTLSSTVTGLGTWFSLTYLWNEQLTLVIVGEGEAEITPVTRLSFDRELPSPAELPVEERAQLWREMKVLQRTTGKPVLVHVGPEVESKRFFFTAPDVKQVELRERLPGLPQFRNWLPLEQLPALRQELRQVEPQLELWLEQVWAQAPMGKIDLGPLRPISEWESGIYVVPTGERWEDDRLQQAVLHAVDWAALIKGVFDQDLPVVVDQMATTGERIHVLDDARAFDFDPERAGRLLAEAGLGDSPMVLAVPPDPALQEMAKLMLEQLGAVGFNPRTIDVFAGRELDQMQPYLLEGQPVLWLSRP